MIKTCLALLVIYSVDPSDQLSTNFNVVSLKEPMFHYEPIPNYSKKIYYNHKYNKKLILLFFVCVCFFFVFFFLFLLLLLLHFFVLMAAMQDDHEHG